MENDATRIAGTTRETSLIFRTRILLNGRRPTSTPTILRKISEGSLRKQFGAPGRLRRPDKINRRAGRPRHELEHSESEWSGRPASNRLPQPWEGCALPGELRPLVRLQILGFFDDALGFRCGLGNNRSNQRRILLHERP